MQAPFDIAADLDTPVSAYLKLAHFEPRFLLESVESGERLGRYSFIGFGGGLDLRLDAQGLHINGEQRERPASQPALLNALREALAQAPRPQPVPEDLPFAGGLVGVAGYDLVRFFESLPDSSADANSLPEAAYFAPSSILVFDHLTRRAALLHDGSDAERLELREDVMSALAGPLPWRKRGGVIGPAQESISQRDFLQAVERVKGHITDGDVYQLVLSVGFSGSCQVDTFEAYRALRLLNPSPYMYYFRFGESAVVGSSPEALVSLHGDRVSLRPIAGTRPRGVSDADDQQHETDLVNDPKEIAEHVMLVDLARNDVGRVAEAGSVYVDPYRVVERYSHVMHLVSGVQAKLREGNDAFDLFAAAFPAGTLVGAPKVRAMELIESLEPTRRGLYAGTVGYFGHDGGLDQAIAIRTLVFHEGRYSFQAGAGIVADSVPEDEYREVLAKSAILRKALAIAEKGL